MLEMIKAEDLKIEKLQASLEYAVMMQKRKLSKAIAQIELEKNLKPNPIVIRNGEPTIVLKFANETIAGFPLRDNLPKKAFLWIRDVWLEEDESQELVWKVYKKMCRDLEKAKQGEKIGDRQLTHHRAKNGEEIH